MEVNINNSTARFCNCESQSTKTLFSQSGARCTAQEGSVPFFFGGGGGERVCIKEEEKKLFNQVTCWDIRTNLHKAEFEGKENLITNIHLAAYGMYKTTTTPQCAEHTRLHQSEAQKQFTGHSKS